MTDTLEGKPVIRKRDGRRGQVMFHAHGKRPRVLFDGAADTVPVPVEGLRVVEKRSSLTGPGLVQPPRHERPETPIERSVRDYAEIAPRADRQKARKSRSFLEHVRAQGCVVSFLGGCWGRIDPAHWPAKKSGDWDGSDFMAVGMCRGHHTEHQEHYRLGDMSRHETDAFIFRRIAELLSDYIINKRLEAA